MTTPAEIAVARFDDHFNCSQSVFAAFAPQYGVQEDLALKIASPFGGGMARQGHVCGAVSGALMALGLARGATTPAGKEKAYQLGEEFIQRFEVKHGTLLCRKLIDCDISTPAGWQIAQERGVFKTVCPVLVREAVEITQDLLGS